MANFQLTVIIIFILLCSFLHLHAEQPDSLAVQDSLNYCATRGHVAEYYTVIKENNRIWTVDYPDSTVVYYYPDSKETGTITRCIRCGKWLSLPEMNPPAYKVVWRRKETIKLNSLGG